MDATHSEKPVKCQVTDEVQSEKPVKCQRILGIVLFAISTTINVISNIFVKELFKGSAITAFEFSYLGALFMAIFFAIYSLATGTNPIYVAKKNISLLVMRSIISSSQMIVFFYSIQITPLSLYSVLSNTSPLFTQLFSVFMLNGAFSKLDVAGALISFVGVCIISLVGSDTVLSSKYPICLVYLLPILSAALTSFLYIYTKLLSNANASMESQGFYVNLLIVYVHMPLAFWMRQDLAIGLSYSWNSMLLIFASIVSGFISFLLFLLSFKYEKAQKLATISYLSVVIYFAADMFIYKITMSFNEIIGSVMILGSCITITMIKALK